MLKNYRIQVVGIVQGVWFRKYTYDSALSCNVVGMVKNEADGSVYVEAEGNETDLKSFIKKLETGSPLSTVREVKWKEGSLNHYSQFEISQ